MTSGNNDDSHPPSHRLRFELILGSVLLAFGLFVLPALIFWVGSALLGPYAEGDGLGTFYGNFYGDLARGEVRAWALSLGPLILIGLLRLLFLRRADENGEENRIAAQQAKPRPPSEPRRVEPRVNLD